jgi:diadenosine tetraphosphatase ApaH/serine/threonine PP2A family protein phosphatase
LHEAESSFQCQSTDICFFGHTHVPHLFIRDMKVHQFFYKKVNVQPGKKYLVNVGSVGEPRDGDWRAAYVVYDTDANTIELRRLPYDLAKARAKLD